MIIKLSCYLEGRHHGNLIKFTAEFQAPRCFGGGFFHFHSEIVFHSRNWILKFKIIIIGIKGLPNAYKLLGRKVPHWAERGAHGCSMRLLENYSSDLQNVAGFILSI